MDDIKSWEKILLVFAIAALVLSAVSDQPSGLSVFIIMALVGLAIAVHRARSQQHMRAIRREIKRLGGHEIDISEQFFERDRDTHTYKVAFVSPSGDRFRTKCKVRSGGSRLYWSRSPAELIRDPVQPYNIAESPGNLRQARLMDDGSQLELRSPKEILIDKLSSPFRHERKAAAEEIAGLSNVDEVVIQRLRELANSDPDQNVREAAEETLTVLGRECRQEDSTASPANGPLHTNEAK